ncbi:unnamed protein product [Arctogadus glacialis]
MGNHIVADCLDRTLSQTFSSRHCVCALKFRRKSSNRTVFYFKNIIYFCFKAISLVCSLRCKLHFKNIILQMTVRILLPEAFTRGGRRCRVKLWYCGAGGHILTD